MALTGPQALRSLDDAMRDIRREEDDISRRMARSAERLAKLRESEVALFRKLAVTRLSDTSTLASNISDAEQRARAMLDQRAADMEAMEKTLKALDETVAEKSEKARGAACRG